MDLPESFRRYGTDILAKNPDVKYEWTTESDGHNLSIPTQSANGFDIRCEIEPDAITLYWGNWHTRYEQTGHIDPLVENVFGIIRDMLSPDMRIRELHSGLSPYKGFLESYDGIRWSTEHTMGLIFWNYFGRRSVRTYSNAILPSRMSKAAILD